MSKKNTYDVLTSRYVIAHGHKPRGMGLWKFTLRRYDVFGRCISTEERSERGAYGETLKNAKRWYDFIIWRNGRNEIEVGS
jgi:hypothetical protein